MPAHRSTPERICPIEGTPVPTTETRFGRGPWRLVRCEKCGFVFLPDPPTYDEVATDFAWESTHAAERARRGRDEPVLAALSEVGKRMRRLLLRRRNPFASMLGSHLARHFAGRRARVLDIGCAGGEFTREILLRTRARGVDVAITGVELSPLLAARARERLAGDGGEVLAMSAIEGIRAQPEGSVAGVVMSSFLEHEAAPLELLREIRRALAPGAAAFAKVPNFACWNRLVRGSRWCGFRYPDHVSYFTPRSLGQLAARSGLALRQGFADRLPLSDNMYARLVRPEG